MCIVSLDMYTGNTLITLRVFIRFHTNKGWGQVNPLWLSVTHRVVDRNHSCSKSPQVVVIIALWRHTSESCE